MKNQRDDKKKSSPGGFIILSLIVFIIFSIGFFPLIIYIRIIIEFFNFIELWQFLFLPFLIYIGFVLLLVSQLAISGSIIKIFNLKYQTGTYEYSYNNKNSLKWIIICSLYTPCRKTIEIFPVGPMKNIYYKMLGMKIGENTLIGGVIKDPCVTEFGDNTTMGEYSIIYGHIHDLHTDIITIKNIKIGNNCVIGAGAIIMPGVIIEDDVILASGALVTQDVVLKKGRIYAGVPAKEIGFNKK